MSSLSVMLDVMRGDVTYRLSGLQPHSQPAAPTLSPLCRTPTPWTGSLRIQGDRSRLSSRVRDALCRSHSNLCCNSMFVLLGEGQRPPTHWNDLHHSSCSLYGETAQPAAHHRPLPQPPPLDVPVAQATGLHRLHSQTLLDTAVAQATCTHQSQPAVGDAVAQGEAQSLQCPLWEKLEKARNYFPGRKK